MRRVVPVVIGLLIAAAVLPFLPTSPAGAVPLPPGLVAPVDLAEVGTNPVFQWDASNTAVRYVVQVSASESMSPLVSGGSITTTNLRATFNEELPNGLLYWRVGAYDTPTGGTPAYSDIWEFTKTKINAPNPLTPAPGDTLTFPTEPPTIGWSAVPGAKSYELLIDNDANLTPPFVVSETTSNTSYTLEEPLNAGQSYWWKVRAKSVTNVTGDYSAPQSFFVEWPIPTGAPVQVSPGIDETTIPPATLPQVEQVQFVWNPVVGAAAYELQFGTDRLWGASSTTTVLVAGAKYSPPTTLDVGSYFWRVRAVSEIEGNGPYSKTFTFARRWPGPQPAPTVAGLGVIQLLAPAHNSLTVREPNFSWTPQRLGSRYQIQISPFSNFSDDVFTATTTHTSYTPYPNTWNPNPGTTYWWRVRALDDPLPVFGKWTDETDFAWKFIYFPEPITQTAPANGSSSIAPRLVWNPTLTPGIGRYRVKVFDATGNQVKQADTFNTSYFPTGLSTDANKNPHRWKVMTLDHDGRVGPEPQGFRTFTVLDPTPGQLEPTPDPIAPQNTAGDHAPPMTWAPVAVNARYTVNYRTQGAPVYQELVSNLTTPGYAHLLDNLSPNTYEWWVEAYDEDGNFISDSNLATFEITHLARSTGVSPANCPPNTACEPLDDTPTMNWDPVIGASHYILWVALDPSFQNIYATYDTQYTQLTPRDSYPDNQAGIAYHWYAQPCYGSVCGVAPALFSGEPQGVTPVKAFRKIARPVPLIAPATDASVTTSQVTFSWDGFLQTNQTGAVADRVTQEARSYIVEVSDKADFSTKIDTSPRLDQTTYTAFNKTYPEGALYWRVLIVDGSQNILTTPPHQRFFKNSPGVTIKAPAAAATVSSAPTLEVTPKVFEVGYEFEVYKNPNSSITPANRIFYAKVAVPAATPTIPLPAGEYGWRVRRLDADERPGAWTADDNSTLRRFTVAGQKANLVNPAQNATVPADRIIYNWGVVNQAVRYRIDVSLSSTFTGPNVESVTTVMNAWAPRTTYANGTYYWRVHTLDADGNIVATSDQRNFTVGIPGSKYVSISPNRILDSRGAIGGWNGQRLGNNQSRALKVAGGSLPAPISATAVVLNVTAVESTAQSFMTLYPSGSPRPTAGSNLNYLPGQIIPNLVTVKVGTDGNVDIYNAVGQVNVIADMVGYYDKTSGDRFNPIAPSRLLDSRTTPQWATGTSGTIGQGQVKAVQVQGVGNVPASAKAAVVNITVVDPTAQSFLMAYPAGTPQPAQASNLNFLPGQIIPNLAIVKLGTGGRINIFNAQGTTNVIVDVVGYFDTDVGSYFHELAPSRILDTRDDVGLTGQFSANQARDLQVTGNGGVPTGATAVVMNTTAVESTALSFLTLYPDGVTRPTSSNLNFSPGQIIPNLVTVGLSAGGKVSIYNNSGKVNVLGDVVGYYAPS